jgi:hypothetical protein
MDRCMNDALGWLEGTALAEAVRGGTWLYAAVESVHLLGLASLFGAIVALDLRLIGLSRKLAALQAMHHLVPVAAVGFVLAAVSGVLMFAADAPALAGNVAFRFKLAFLALAGVNAAAFHRGPFRAMAAWSPQSRPPTASIVMGLCSLLLWTSVVVCGRLIAYV